MNDLERTLHTVANNRRRELLPFVYHHTKGCVASGPFRGMAILPYYMWGDGDTAAKLLGVYENELHPAIEDAIRWQPDLIVNVGSAEGFYAVGMALRTKVKTVAADIDPRAQSITQQNAQANGIALSVMGEISTHNLELIIKDHSRPLIIMDCEGAEDELLDIVLVRDLAKCMIIVESHDVIKPGITQRLADRFAATHAVTVIKQCMKDPYQFAFLDSIGDCDKWCLVHEGRPETSYWLGMVPR